MSMPPLTTDQPLRKTSPNFQAFLPVHRPLFFSDPWSFAEASPSSVVLSSVGREAASFSLRMSSASPFDPPGACVEYTTLDWRKRVFIAQAGNAVLRLSVLINALATVCEKRRCLHFLTTHMQALYAAILMLQYFLRLLSKRIEITSLGMMQESVCVCVCVGGGCRCGGGGGGFGPWGGGGGGGL